MALLQELASPAYEGRGVGTTGLSRARDLLINQLQASGLAPAFAVKDPEGHETGRTYTQSLRVFVGNELGERNFFAGSSPVDFVPLAFSKSGFLSQAPVVFAGYGITLRSDGAPNTAPYDDYAGLDVQGKIVIVMLGDPSIGNRNSPFRDPAYFQYSTPMYKVQNAELHGAAGVVLVRDAYSQAGADEPLLRFQSRQGGGATVAALAGQARIDFAEKLLGRRIVDIQTEIARTQAPLSFAVPGNFDLAVDLKRQVGEVQNVAALIPGTDPGLARQFVVIGAHYDHLGYGGDSSMDPDGIGKIHPGADDNASGVQAVFDLAQRIRHEGGNRRPVIVVFFTAEEIGLLGSKHWVESLPLPEGAQLAFMVNLDMVGRLEGNRLSAIAAASGKEFKALLEERNREFGFSLLMSDEGLGSSDHASFLQIQVPALFFTTGAHADYHRPSDTSEKINGDGLARIEDFTLEVWRALDARDAAPTYDPASEGTNAPPRPGRGYGVYLGTVPEFSQGDTPGVLLSGVRPGSPAERAGLQKGDVVTGLGEIEVRSLSDLVFALRFYRPNEEVEVRWLRLGVPMKAETTLRARQ